MVLQVGESEWNAARSEAKEGSSQQMVRVSALVPADAQDVRVGALYERRGDPEGFSHTREEAAEGEGETNERVLDTRAVLHRARAINPDLAW